MERPLFLIPKLSLSSFPSLSSLKAFLASRGDELQVFLKKTFSLLFFQSRKDFMEF